MAGRKTARWVTMIAVVGGLLLGQSVEAVAAGANLVTNPKFIEGTTGWNAGAGNGLVVVPGGHDSRYAGEVSNLVKKAHTCLLSDDPDTVLSASAGGYVADIWLEGPPGSVIFSMKEHNPGHTVVVGEVKQRLSLTGSWQKVSLSYTVVTPGDSLGITVSEGRAEPGECFQADDAYVAFEGSGS
jgi:hypothetical protein